MTLELIIIACVVSALSGAFELVLPRRSALGQIVAVALMVVSALAGVAGALRGLIEGTTSSVILPGVLTDWSFHVKSDPLSSFFLIPIFLLGAVGSVYGLRYWPQPEHSGNGRKLSFCYGLLIAGLSMVTLAADGITFLFAWELMALSAFFLVSTEDHKAEARRAGWIYLVATHIGTLTLFGLFALLRFATGSFELRKLLPTEAGSGLQALIFLVALMGFGLKAGMMPLHFWLPGAHASAPSHVSAVLSGVLLKIGIYGLIRVSMLLPNLPVACGLLVLAMGVVSAVLGVGFALGQHDFKRLLAYHSIENIGIILIGLGLAIVGFATHEMELLTFGLAGCLLHIWNHSVFKSLLFLAAGSVVHATHSREIDHLGGLAKQMPQTALLFAIGAVAICGLPPLNGFVSEFIIYLGLFRTAADAHASFSGIALAVPALAITGTLAVACFVKAYGAVFLGTARTGAAKDAQESPFAMVAPMALLAAICATIGLLPILVFPLLDRVIATWPGFDGPRLANLLPHAVMTTLSVLLVSLIVIGAILVRRQSTRKSKRASVTWDCGYIRPEGTMQYTSSSFASTLVRLFRWILRPQIYRRPATGLFPDRAVFETHVPEIVLDGFLNPVWRRIKSELASLKVLQQGRVQQYLLYILLALFGMLLSLVPVIELAKKLLGR